jgi:hypothetical protein
MTTMSSSSTINQPSRSGTSDWEVLQIVQDCMLMKQLT